MIDIILPQAAQLTVWCGGGWERETRRKDKERETEWERRGEETGREREVGQTGRERGGRDGEAGLPGSGKVNV